MAAQIINDPGDELLISWYNFGVACIKCPEKRKMKIADLLFSADGEIRLIMKCPCCDTETPIDTSGASLVMRATMLDVAKQSQKRKLRKKHPDLDTNQPIDTAEPPPKWLQ